MWPYAAAAERIRILRERAEGDGTSQSKFSVENYAVPEVS